MRPLRTHDPFAMDFLETLVGLDMMDMDSYNHYCYDNKLDIFKVFYKVDPRDMANKCRIPCKQDNLPGGFIPWTCHYRKELQAWFYHYSHRYNELVRRFHPHDPPQEVLDSLVERRLL